MTQEWCDVQTCKQPGRETLLNNRNELRRLGSPIAVSLFILRVRTHKKHLKHFFRLKVVTLERERMRVHFLDDIQFVAAKAFAINEDECFPISWAHCSMKISFPDPLCLCGLAALTTWESSDSKSCWGKIAVSNPSLYLAHPSSIYKWDILLLRSLALFT